MLALGGAATLQAAVMGYLGHALDHAAGHTTVARGDLTSVIEGVAFQANFPRAERRRRGGPRA